MKRYESNMKARYIKPKDTTPYFYIIKHKPSGMMYAGARWAARCHPDELLQPNGYKTSSTLVHTLIERDGLDSFEIIRADSNLDGLTAYEYETSFLQAMACSKSEEWINTHDNNNKTYRFVGGSVEHKKIMNIRHGVDNPSQSPILQEKKFQTFIERFGYDNPSKSPEIQQRICDRMVELYGAPYVLQVPELRERITQTLLDAYGVDHNSKIEGRKERMMERSMEKHGVPFPCQLDSIKDQVRQTNLERRGVGCSFQDEETKAKSRQTNLERYGFENAYQSPEIQEKVKQNNMEKYGYEYVMQRPEVRETRVRNNIAKYGVANPSQLQEVQEKCRITREKNASDHTCIHCGKVTHGTLVLHNIHHGDNCKHRKNEDGTPYIHNREILKCSCGKFETDTKKIMTEHHRLCSGSVVLEGVDPSSIIEKMWVNNGVAHGRVDITTELPEGWNIGRLPTRTKICKNIEELISQTRHQLENS